ncbi:MULTISPECIES: hypothetical protein [unclassified Okeania]|uniref:hypothetical protein n=1 Tax=unclassified Okeania TaxID=2634635 RepID=UPI0013BDB461|nr:MULTISPECIES: hypothetical protein [unclassified Okeania]NET13967.1 hypothetical protein [Okeania sp. SIO1H6]NES76673.1 hypothetical protein [Okeania sp. SIO1H4]NET20304.1 hypothetical protein [Okeania sp. SIO1H5]NET77100.1 hypothetical protein [Okeania sp. SIO1F9]NET96009.1 hypothetical protein [Okeania sp. SIO1H2]
MTTVTSEEITQSRSALSDDQASHALKVIEECEGNLEDAFEVLMIESESEEGVKGLEFSLSLEQLALKCRDVICEQEFREEILDGFSRELLNGLVPVVSAELTLMGNLPAALAIPVVMFVIKRGIKSFCKSYEPKS